MLQLKEILPSFLKTVPLIYSTFYTTNINFFNSYFSFCMCVGDRVPWLRQGAAYHNGVLMSFRNQSTCVLGWKFWYLDRFHTEYSGFPPLVSVQQIWHTLSNWQGRSVTYWKPRRLSLYEETFAFVSQSGFVYLLTVGIDGCCWAGSYSVTHHSRWDSPGRGIGLTRRPLPDNTQHSQETDFHVFGGIRTRNPS